MVRGLGESQGFQERVGGSGGDWRSGRGQGVQERVRESGRSWGSRKGAWGLGGELGSGRGI